MTATISPRITTTNRTRLETVIPLSTPYLVFLDPSDICNAKCSWCPTGSGEAKKYRKPQLMERKLYCKIIDDLAAMPEKIKVLRLYSDGEPLLNDAIIEMIQYASDTHRFGQIDLTTNGILLTPPMSDGLIDAGLNKIFISVPQNYGAFFIVRVAYLYKYGRNKLHVHVKIIGDGISDTAKENFMRDFSHISDSIFIEHLSPCWPGYKVDGVGKVGIYGQSVKEVIVCPYIFYSVKINSDGTVSLCFLDWKHDMIVGDLKTESFKDVWNGEKLYHERMYHLHGMRKDRISGCNECGQLRYGAPDDIDQYADEILGKLK